MIPIESEPSISDYGVLEGRDSAKDEAIVRRARQLLCHHFSDLSERQPRFSMRQHACNDALNEGRGAPLVSLCTIDLVISGPDATFPHSD